MTTSTRLAFLPQPKQQLKESVEFSSSCSSLKDTRMALLDRSFGRSDISDKELGYLTDSFKMWSAKPSFLAFLDPSNNNILFRRAAKRGNKVYADRINDRIDNALAQLEVSKVPELCVRPHKSGVGFVSNVFFVTNTWDTNKFPNRIDSWSKHLSKEYNKFITQLRKETRFGKCWVWRVYESTQSGYPHSHELIISEIPQPVYLHKSKDGSRSWRLCDKTTVSDCWHSNVDVKAAFDIESVSAYLSKDLRKQITLADGQSVMTAAMCWLFKKRSYSISSNFDLIEVCVSQTAPVLEQYQEAVKEGLVFLGIINISTWKGIPPPDSVEVKATPSVLKDMCSYISCPSESFGDLVFAKTGLIIGFDI